MNPESLATFQARETERNNGADSSRGTPTDAVAPLIPADGPGDDFSLWQESLPGMSVSDVLLSTQPLTELDSADLEDEEEHFATQGGGRATMEGTSAPPPILSPTGPVQSTPA